jgi:hypothetical protein
MTFAARQHELMRHLQWGPTRGRKRRERLAEIRTLVREELEREVRGVEAPPSPPATTTVSLSHPGRRAWWHDREEEDSE